MCTNIHVSDSHTALPPYFAYTMQTIREKTTKNHTLFYICFTLTHTLTHEYPSVCIFTQ